VTLLICTVTGMVAAQAVAWLCYGCAKASYLGDRPLPAARLHLPAFLRGAAAGGSNPGWTEPSEGSFRAGLTLGHTGTTLRCPVPGPAGADAAYAANPAQYGLYTESFGWPCRSLAVYRACVFTFGGNGDHLNVGEFFRAVESRAGLRLGVVSTHRDKSGAVRHSFPANPAFGELVPVWPLWPGLAVNASAYGLAAWGVLYGAAACRRVRRRRRGLCIACGYLLDGVSPCPECGTASVRKTPLSA
jgi:hypothetical protein